MNKLRTISFLVLVLLLAVVIPSAVTALNLKYPKDKAVIDTSTPELSWESVDLAFIYEVSVWKQGSSNLVYHGYPTDTKLKIASQDALKNGVTYIWMVKAKSSISSPAIEESSRWTFSCGQAAKQDDNIGTFKKNGATLVIPVEFKSHKFKGDPVEIVTKKMKEMEDYYRAISYNDDGTMREVACDVAPGIYLNVDRTHYSADKKD
ncbi:MAG: hypothetical protein QGH40_03850, partial [bacterium]|nr:hypothetical protein [bacterium]